MMKVTQAAASRQKDKRLIPAHRKKGVITKFYGLARTVDLYFIDNPQTIVKQVTLSYETFSSLNNYFFASTGNIVRCVVEIFDETNTRDMVVIATY